jgi:hypothetical protein
LATYHAIAATGQAILGLLEDACPKPEFTGVLFRLYQPSDFPTHIDEGVSLYLYRVTVNSTRRSLPPRLGADGRSYRGPLPLDLHYLLTVWAKDTVKQQRLLGWCMRALEDTPVLPAGLLNRAGPEPEIFRRTETVELTADPVSLQDMTNILEPLKPHVAVSVTYVARMVLLESTIVVPEGELVQTRVFDYATAVTR